MPERERQQGGQEVGSTVKFASWRRPMARTAVCLCGLLALACGSGGSSSATPAPAASLKPESEVVIAGPTGASGAVWKKLANEWATPLGVKVTYVEGTSASNFAKIQAQAKAGSVQIDIQNNNDQIIALGRAQGIWANIDPKIVTNLKDLAAEYALPKDVVGSPAQGVFVQVIPAGIAYNKDVFTKKGWAPPSSWLDLYDPKYATCVIPLSPQSGVPWIPWVNYLNSKDYGNISTTISSFKKIAKQVPVFADNNATAVKQVAQGVGCMTPTSQGRFIEGASAGPIAFVYPKEGSPYFGGGIAIPKGAPHPIAAQMLLNVFLSAEAGNVIIANSYYPPTNTKVVKPTSGPGVDVTTAKEFAKVPGGLHYVPISTYDHLDDWIRQWSDMASSR
jgi:putative spermidine/putrescine transport system substrate-binding protein